MSQLLMVIPGFLLVVVVALLYLLPSFFLLSSKPVLLSIPEKKNSYFITLKIGSLDNRKSVSYNDEVMVIQTFIFVFQNRENRKCICRLGCSSMH